MPASTAVTRPRRSRGEDRPSRGRGARRRPWRALLAASVALAVAGQAPADAATPPFAIDVSDQQAVFQLGNLKPGPIGSRCLLLSIRNGSADEVLLSATVGGTGLAAYLDLVVEVGTSADPATCTDFVGAAAFTGTLDALGTQHATPAAGVPLPLTDDTAVVRFTLALQSDNGAQGRTATATFRFDATDTTGLPPTTTAPPTTTPTTAPPTSPPATAPPTTATDPGTTPPTSPTGTAPAPTRRTTSTTAAPTTTSTSTTLAPTTTSTTATVTTVPAAGGSRRSGSTAGTGGGDTTVPDAGTGASAPGTAPEVVVTDPTEPAEPEPIVARAVAVVTETATTAAKTSSVPAGFLSFVFLFLVVQDRFDRNDPKLARAPLAPEPEMVFQPRHGRFRS